MQAPNHGHRAARARSGASDRYAVGPPVPSRPAGAGRGGRVRRPRPLLRKRLPSGRGASEQPNTTDETARLTPVFWALLLATAVATGLLGSALMFLLTTVEHLAFG